MTACGGGGGSEGNGPSNNANLSALGVSQGTLSPAFNPDIMSYAVEVPFTVASVTVTPTAAEAHASITVNSTAVASGTASGDITLNTGLNTITVIVTAEDGVTTKTYTITVTKLAEPSHNADLAGLTLSQGTLSPVFSSATTSYTATVPDTAAFITVTSTAAGVNASITVNSVSVVSGTPSGNIAVSEGATITIVVTAEDGTTTKTYTVTVTLTVTIPAAPTNLVISSSTTTQINLFWTDNSNNEDGFKIEKSVNSGATYTQIATVSQNVTVYLATGLTPTTRYDFRVRAYNAAGDSTYSNATHATTPAINLPKTSQSTCYNNAGSVISCATTTGQGQDGALQRGVAWPNPRFTVVSNVSGTVVTDNLTGLMWLKDANCINTRYSTFDNDGTAGDGKVTWQHALDFVAGINAGTYPNCGVGYTDWRLPNREELRSLGNYVASSMQIDRAAWLTSQGFGNVQTYYYWSSTAYAENTAYRWLGLVDGTVVGGTMGVAAYVWPVRDAGISVAASLPKTGQTTSFAAGDDGDLQKGVVWPNPRFSVGTGGEVDCVTDKLTGLTWVKALSTTTVIWTDALAYANGLSLCGFTDWRLPNVNELASLVHSGFSEELCNSSLCATNADWLNTQGFSNVGAGGGFTYWSSTTNNSAAPWLASSIVMSDSSVAAYAKDAASESVWPVRGGQ